MRLLSAALTNSKNQIDGGSPWTMLFELSIIGAPTLYNLAAYDQDIVFHGQTYTRFPVNVDALEEPTSMSLLQLRVTAANVDQQIQSLLENYWAPIPDPHWTVSVWQIDVTQPDETPLSYADVFTVQQVTTDFLVATFDLTAEGLALTTTVPKRRYTTSGGFPNLPRRI
jgi:hypothetical protein